MFSSDRHFYLCLCIKHTMYIILSLALCLTMVVNNVLSSESYRNRIISHNLYALTGMTVNRTTTDQMYLRKIHEKQPGTPLWLPYMYERIIRVLMNQRWLGVKHIIDTLGAVFGESLNRCYGHNLLKEYSEQREDCEPLKNCSVLVVSDYRIQFTSEPCINLDNILMLTIYVRQSNHLALFS